MTTIETTDTTENTAAEAPAEPTVKYPTYAELARAAWKLAFTLSERGKGSFCVSGTNDYLRALDLPDLAPTSVGENEEQADSYFAAWLQFKYWRPDGQLTEEDSAHMRTTLVRNIRVRLERGEPARRNVMNEWLRELGLEELKPPRNFSTYRIGVRSELTVRQMQDAINAAFPQADVEVNYY